MSIISRDNQTIWHPFTPLSDKQKILAIEKGQGIYLYTTDGRAIIDAISSWWVNLHGHSHPYIAQVLFEQALKLEHVIFAGFTHEPAILLAERLLKILPSNQSKIFYSDNGSTACEVAIKMALQYWHNQGMAKTKIIALQGAYHGDTFGAMSVGDRNVFTSAFSPLLFDVDFLNFPNCNRINCCGGNRTNEQNCNNVHIILQQFEHLVKNKDIAAFIYEPLIQGSAGMRMYSPEILDNLLTIAKAHYVICIADEVMTGFGRTGKLFASEYCQQQPDIICLSKGLTGGTMALGVTSCTEKIIEVFEKKDITKTFFHGHSYTANPLACAVANASLDLLLQPSCFENIYKIHQQHLAFELRIQSHPQVMQVSVLGTILAVEIKSSAKTSYFNELRNSLYDYFIAKNILLRPLGNIIYILPPYIITADELKIVYEAIWEFLIFLND